MANKRKDRKGYSKGSREDYTNGGRVGYAQGLGVSKDVSDVKNEPENRVDPFTGQPYAVQSQSLQPSWLLSCFTALLTAVAGLLMVSNFKYPSFKQIDLRGRVPFVVILSIVMSFVVITIDPPRILLMLALGFALYAPVKFLWAKLH